jgi:hypothetical protein
MHRSWKIDLNEHLTRHPHTTYDLLLARHANGEVDVVAAHRLQS